MKKFLIGLLVLGSMVSCVSERIAEEYVPADGPEADVVLRLHSLQAFDTATRALSEQQQAKIEEVHVLVFRGGELRYIRQGMMAGDNSFSVSIPHGTYDLRVITNAGALIESLESKGIAGTIINIVDGKIEIEAGTGATPEEVAAALWLPATDKLFTATDSLIPMSGKLLKAVEVKEGGDALNVQLQRSVAKVDVGVGEWGAGGWDGDDIDFELEEIRVYRSNNKYALIPHNDTPTVPTLPKETKQLDEPIKYNSEDEFHIDNTIFIPEQVVEGTAHDERLALVVAGSYKGGKATYYRLDFYDGKNFLNIIRNHIYRFSITAVMGPGYDSPELALTSTAMNMTAEVMDWEDGMSTHIAFDGDKYFAIDKREVVFDALGNTTETLVIRTNVEDFAMTAGAVRVVPEGASHTSATARNEYTITHGQGDNYTMTIRSTAHNISAAGAERADTWTFEAGRMRIPFSVTQQGRVVYITVDGEELTGEGGGKHLFPSGGTALVSVRSAVALNIDAVPAWLTGVRQPALSNGLYTVDFTASASAFAHTMAETNDREATLKFTPTTGAALSFAITQEPFSLRPIEQTVPSIIPQAGDTYRFTAFTNYQGWGVKVFVGAKNNGAALVSKPFGTGVTIDPNAPAGFYSLDVAVPGSAAAERLLSFWLYCTENGGTGNEVKIGEWLQAGEVGVPVAQPVRDEDAPYILYFDGERLQAGRWGNPVAQGNMIFAKFGSLVGFTMAAAGDTWGMDDVKFDPMATPAADYAAIPYMNAAIVSQGMVTASHNEANLAQGRGDICRLVGLTPAHARAMIASGKLSDYDSGLRLPRQDEYAATHTAATFVTATVGGKSGRWLGGAPNASSFLPYAGRRSTAGAPEQLDTNGYYWSSSSNIGFGSAFLFNSTGAVSTNITTAVQYAYAVRCVSMIPTTVVSVVAADERGTVNMASHTGKQGEMFEAKATPAPGYSFTRWEATGATLSNASANPVTITHGATNGTVTAIFSAKAHAVTATVLSGSGTATPSKASATTGEKITVTAAAAAGYSFAGWTLSNASFDTGSTATSTTATIIIGDADGPVTATATFAPATHMINKTAVNGQIASVASAGTGETVSIVAIPDAGYKFKSWAVSNATPAAPATPSADIVIGSIAGPVGLTATFEAAPNANTVNVTANNLNYGDMTVRVHTGMANETFSVTAVPAPGYTFTSWTAPAGVLTTAATANPATIKHGTANATVTANFAAQSHAITKTASGGGSITAPTAASANTGDKVTITAAPNAGYEFVGWTLSNATIETGSTATATATVIIGSTEGPVTLNAAFAPKSHDITKTATNGQIASVATARTGEKVSIVAIPDPGYKFKSWAVTNATPAAPTTQTAEITVGAADGAVGVTATFEELTVEAGPTATAITVASSDLTMGHANVSSHEGASGSKFTVQAIPAPGYNFVNWTWTTAGTGNLPAGTQAGNPLTVTHGTSAGVLQANFAAVSHTITRTATNGSITAPATADTGASATVTATANEGYQFAGWNLTNATFATGHNASTSPANIVIGTGGNVNVKAVFEPTSHTITKIATNGTITGVASAKTGEVVSLVATPNRGYVFNGWEFDNATGTDTTASTVITVGTKDGAVTATASFAAMPVKPAIGTGKAPYILYMNGDKLDLGRWGEGVASSNMIFTKFGSIVGLVNNQSFWIDNLRFDPTGTTYASSEAGYQSVPCFDFEDDELGNLFIDGFISSPQYHNNTNLAMGRGDICKLVGLDSSKARELLLNGSLADYDSGFRLPTHVDNVDFINVTKAEYKGTGTLYNNDNYPFNGAAAKGGGNGCYFPILGDRESDTGRALNSNPAGFLPATGKRLDNGVFEGGDPDIYSCWWSSMPYISSMQSFGENFAFGFANEGESLAVRCVPNTGQVVNVPPVPNNTVTIKTDGYDPDSGSVNIQQHTGRKGDTFTVTATPGGSGYTVSWEVTGGATISGSGNTRTVTHGDTNGTVTVTFRLLSIPTSPSFGPDKAPYILYMEGNRLMAGRVGQGVAPNNIVYVRPSSLYGSTYSGGGLWSEEYMAFNPGKGNYSGTFESIPYSTSTSVVAHNSANVSSGLGDICKLAGLTSAQAQELNNDAALYQYDSGLRLPTTHELYYYLYYGSLARRLSIQSWQFTGGIWLDKYPDASTFLPDAGNYYYATGSHGGMNYYGAYWGSGYNTLDLVPPSSGEYIAINEARGSSANTVRCIPSDPSVPRKDLLPVHILYWDGHKLNVGQFGSTPVTVDQDNIVFTKYGSLVGFTMNKSGYIARENVVFDPTDKNIAGYRFDRSEWMGVPFVDPSLPTPPNVGTGSSDHYVGAFHTSANLLNGIGDICRLVGLTPEKARQMATNNTLVQYKSGYRLPTLDEASHLTISGGYSATINGTTNGIWSALIPNSSTFWPYSGYYYNGLHQSFGVEGRFWTASVYMGESGVWMSAKGGSLGNETYDGESPYGYAVRCIPEN